MNQFSAVSHYRRICWNAMPCKFLYGNTTHNSSSNNNNNNNNLLWLHYPKAFTIRAFLVVLLRPSLSCPTFLLLNITIFLISFSTAYFHLALGLSVGKFWCKVAWHIFLVHLESFVRCRCPKCNTYLNKSKTDNFLDILYVCTVMAPLNHLCVLHTFAVMPVTTELHILMTEPQPKIFFLS